MRAICSHTNLLCWAWLWMQFYALPDDNYDVFWQPLQFSRWLDPVLCMGQHTGFRFNNFWQRVLLFDRVPQKTFLQKTSRVRALRHNSHSNTESFIVRFVLLVKVKHLCLISWMNMSNSVVTHNSITLAGFSVTAYTTWHFQSILSGDTSFSTTTSLLNSLVPHAAHLYSTTYA